MKTILLVEDEALLAENLQRYLTREGYRCLWCDTLAAAEQQWLAADLVLLESHHARGGCPRLAAPVAGAQGTAGDRAHRKGGGEQWVAGLDAGARDYLTKPFSHDELLARIRAQLRQLGMALRLWAVCSFIPPGCRRAGRMRR